MVMIMEALAMKQELNWCRPRQVIFAAKSEEIIGEPKKDWAGLPIAI